ncbi:MAG: metallophosphoesterase [Sphingobacteriales bacterium]|nr:metallophosphoesterase [Sphingobacteriales bacterium]
MAWWSCMVESPPPAPAHCADVGIVAADDPQLQPDYRAAAPDTLVPFPADVEFAVIGDYGKNTPEAQQVAAMVQSWQPAFIITVGDNVYEMFGDASTYHNLVGSLYCDYIYNPDAPEALRCNGEAAQAHQNRFFPSVGNHDYYVDGTLNPYKTYFTLPGAEEYYDFVWGQVHFFMINSGKNGDSTCCASTQSRLLRKKICFSEEPYKIAVLHHPPFSVADHGNNENMQTWNFEEWGITAVISGHDHTYQRIQRKSTGFPYFLSGVGVHLYIIVGQNRLTVPNFRRIAMPKTTELCA